MYKDDGYELHDVIKKLRLERGYTQKYVADYLGINVSTYAHYELGRRTPDIKKLRALAKFYGLNDELLGAKLPIVAKAIYPVELLENLENAVKNCPEHTSDFYQNKKAYDRLKSALKPVLEIREEALSVPDIDFKEHKNLTPGTTIVSVELDMRAEGLILSCLDKLDKLI